MEAQCIVCLTEKAQKHLDYAAGSVFYECPVCGRFEFATPDSMDLNKLSSYLFYNRFDVKNYTDLRYHTTLKKELCDKYQQNYDSGNLRNGRPVHMDDEMVNSWYPKSFSERVDMILQKINSLSRHVGQIVTFSYEETISLLFVDRFETNGNDQYDHRDRNEYQNEARFMFDYLIKQEFIEGSGGETMRVMLMPKGLAQVEKYERNSGTGRNVLIAMQFGEETMELREAIKEGVRSAGYNPILVDEVEHNEFITPEILRHIRNSKFVVVDLTHKNNGAYFEEGYAMGLGKPVIQLCRDGEKLHFDIAQKNTIMWKSEDEIPLRLKNRILATID